MTPYEVVIIGGGAAGLMCAIEAGKRGRSVASSSIATASAKRSSFPAAAAATSPTSTSRRTNFLSANPHFCKSALARYTQWDFIALVERHGMPYHEKKLGQLFCDNKSKVHPQNAPGRMPPGGRATCDLDCTRCSQVEKRRAATC